MSETRPTRREILVKAGKIALAAAIDAPIVDSIVSLTTSADEAPTITRPYWEWASTSNIAIAPEKLEKEMTDKFGLSFLEPSSGTPFIKDSTGLTYPTFNWDQPRLTVLSRVLSDLPKHFYRLKGPDGKPKKILVALIDRPANTTEYWSFCNCNDDFSSGAYGDQELLGFDKKKKFNTIPALVDSARNTIVHEFIHAFTVPEIQKYLQAICVPIGINHETQLQQIFAEEIKNNTLLGYGGKNFHEFLAVAAGIYYIHGKEYFVNNYGKYLGKDMAAALYENVREELFAGKEYK